MVFLLLVDDECAVILLHFYNSKMLSGLNKLQYYVAYTDREQLISIVQYSLEIFKFLK